MTENDLSFSYHEIENAYAKHTGNNFRIYGSFGTLKFKGKTYSASQLTFYRKSEHSFGPNQQHLDLEMQILHESADMKKLVVVVNYKSTSKGSIFMDQLNLGQFKDIQAGDSRPLKKPLDVGLVFNKVTTIVQYTGTLSQPPCALDVQYLILSNIRKVKAEDLKGFPHDLVGKKRKTQERNDRALILINYKSGVQVSDNSVSDKPESSYGTYEKVEHVSNTIQGFKLAPDRNITVSAKSPYPIVSDINTRLPFPERKKVDPKATEKSSHKVFPSSAAKTHEVHKAETDKSSEKVDEVKKEEVHKEDEKSTQTTTTETTQAEAKKDETVKEESVKQEEVQKEQTQTETAKAKEEPKSEEGKVTETTQQEEKKESGATESEDNTQSQTSETIEDSDNSVDIGISRKEQKDLEFQEKVELEERQSAAKKRDEESDHWLSDTFQQSFENL